MKKYEKGKYVNWVGSRGQETLRLGSEGCWSEGWVAAAPGPQNGHSEPHSYNIHMSRLQFARASLIKNAAHHPFVCLFVCLINGSCPLSVVLLSSGHVLGFIQLS